MRKRTQFFSIHRMTAKLEVRFWFSADPGAAEGRLAGAEALVARVEAGEALPRQDAPGPLVRRHIPANVAVAVLPLLNDAKSVAEKVEAGRVAWKSRVDDVDGIGVDIVLQTRSRFLPGAAAQCQKCQERCSCAAPGSAPLNDRRSILV